MELNKNNINYGKCRCCLSKGYHEDLMKEYNCGNIRENYSDLFVDCFNLFLCTDVRLSTLICPSCTQHLKAAYHFKKKVLEVEKKLLQLLNPPNEKETLFIDVTGVTGGLNEDKDICIKNENDNSENDLSGNESMDIEKDSHAEELISIEEMELVNRYPRESLKKLPTVSSLDSICPKYAVELRKLKGKLITAKILQQNLSKVNKEKPISEKFAHITNITTLLSCSNLTAFKTKYKNGFPCFYCSMRFDNFDMLREHQYEHKNDDIRRLVIRKYRPGRPDCLVVYAEVTDLKCTVCNLNMLNLTDLKSHLYNTHKKKLYMEYTDRVIPFKMCNNVYRCQRCGFDFETFGAIERHMNTHYRNYVCEECGAGFIAKHRLKIHKYALHSRLGEFPCGVCEKIYPTRKKMRLHFENVHAVAKKIKCPKCPAKFLYYVVRQTHLVDVHGEDPIIYKCNVCEKAFKRRYALSKHIKKDHLNEKNVSCKLCSFNCFSNSELQVHLVKQHGEKPFECAVCKKCYATQKTLSQHLSQHTNTKYCCAVCGESFVQNRSFKIHMKSHL